MPFGRFRFSYDYGGSRIFTNAETTLPMYERYKPNPSVSRGTYIKGFTITKELLKTYHSKKTLSNILYIFFTLYTYQIKKGGLK